MGGTEATCLREVWAPRPFHRTFSALFIESNELLSSFKEKKKKKKRQGKEKGKKGKKKEKKNIKIAKRSAWNPLYVHPRTVCVLDFGNNGGEPENIYFTKLKKKKKKTF